MFLALIAICFIAYRLTQKEERQVENLDKERNEFIEKRDEEIRK